MGLISIGKEDRKTYFDEVDMNLYYQNNPSMYAKMMQNTPQVINDRGMNNGVIKGEIGIVNIIAQTIMISVVLLAVILVLLYVGIKLTGFNFDFFSSDSYDLSSYNRAVRNSFLVVSALVIVIGVVTMFAINVTIKIKLGRHYLTKINMYIYRFFVVAYDLLVYGGIILVFFKAIDKLTEKANHMFETGIITEEVNLGTIDLFKYVVVIFMVIFMVVNCFRVWKIVNDKNGFVLEEEM